MRDSKPPAGSTPDDASTRTLSSPLSGGHPSRIGPYRILELLGEGGMGMVYLAEQEQPVRRRVALKLIKPGLDTREVLARFESERQALAILSHPNIARVFEAGTTEQGHPFFVMEHVPGIPLQDYCDRHRLTTAERLRIFLPICQAIQHAHQKGIIHRDLKPSNVLVSLQDGVAVPKVIDFGVAKATHQRLTEKTLYTRQGLLIGTPEYMSPEQAEMSGLDVDTTTDIYSLGVILYELLAGVRPFDFGRRREAGLEEIRRAIREQEPRRPSTRLGGLGEEAEESAARRGTDARGLSRQLRGDLDWIVMKAMEKDRTRRYASCSELAAEISRHLGHEPVLAGPPSRVYRTRKFVRRHRLGVTAGVMVAVAVLLGAGGAALGLVRARRAEGVAKSEAETARQVSEFLIGLFKVSDPGEARGRSITAREILEEGSRQIQAGLKDQPLVQARMMDTMGQVYQNLGLYDRAGELLEGALTVRQARKGREDPEVAESLSHVGYLRQKQGRPQEARKLQEEALSIRERLLGPEHLDTAWSRFYLGSSMTLTGDYEEAARHLEEALVIFERELGPDDLAVAWCLNDLGMIHFFHGDYAKTAPLFERALAIKEKSLGPEHFDVAMALNNLGYVLARTGDYGRARPVLERAIGIDERILGPEHPELAYHLHTLGELFRMTGEYDAGRPVLRRAVSILEAKTGSTSPPIATILSSLAQLEAGAGDLMAAERFYQRVLSIREKTLPPDSPDLLRTLDEYAALLRRMGRHGDAEGLEQRAADIRGREGSPEGS